MAASVLQKTVERHWQRVAVIVRSPGRMPAVLLWVGLALLAYESAGLTWRLLDRPQAPVPAQLNQLATVLPVEQQALGGRIAAQHLFGEPMVAITAPVESAPVSRSDLVLKGVFAVGGGRGAAIIADGTTQKYVVTGESLADGAVLREVHRDRVVLSRNGQLETLALPKNELPAPPIPGATADAAGGGDPAHFSNPENGLLLRQYRETLRSQPQALMGLMNATPAVEGGKVIGSRLTAGQDPSLLSRFGLQSGDIITSVNGTALDGRVKGLDVLKGLSGAQQLNVTLVRNGQPMSFVYQVANE